MTQTVKVPADRRIMLDVPPQIPTGETARFEIIWYPVNNEVKPSTKSNISLPRDKDGKILLTKEVIDEMEKNSPNTRALSGMLSELKDADLDEIRYKALAEKHLK
jgi:hypothetical protein